MSMKNKYKEDSFAMQNQKPDKIILFDPRKYSLDTLLKEVIKTLSEGKEININESDQEDILFSVFSDIQELESKNSLTKEQISHMLLTTLKMHSVCKKLYL